MSAKRKNANPQPGPNNPKEPSKWGRLLTILFYVVAVFLVASWMFGDKESRTKKELSYTKFAAYVENNMVEKVVIYDDNSAKANNSARNRIFNEKRKVSFQTRSKKQND